MSTLSRQPMSDSVTRITKDAIQHNSTYQMLTEMRDQIKVVTHV